MKGLIEASFAVPRTMMVALVITVVAGFIAYVEIPKESSPDIPIPVIYVSLSHPGIAPEDAVRLLVKPMERELQGLRGVDEIRSVAAQGHASIMLEFEPGFDADQALERVRNRVDRARAELPENTNEPRVQQINTALFPVLVINLYGDVSERMRVRLAQQLQDRLEGLSGVLEVDIGGDREEQIEIIVDPTRLRTYGLSLQQVAQSVARNNQLVAAGVLSSGSGRFPLKVPGVIDDPEELLGLAIKAVDGQVVTVSDVASVRRSFKDPQGYARINGVPALALEVVKRPGANIIETIANVRKVTQQMSARWPAAVQISFTQDRSQDVRTMLSNLQNSVLSSVLLVMIMIVAILGLRAGLLVGVSIPGSFLLGMLALAAMGLTINTVVLFSLILALGLLVDGAITVVELADRHQAGGQHRREAYKHAAQRLAWPITSSTLAMLAAFIPLLFWPGIAGEFMKYLPITLLAVLSASLLMALIFVPNLGALMGGVPPSGGEVAWRPGDRLTGFVGMYVRAMRHLLRHAGKVVAVTVLLLLGSFGLYAVAGNGITFFPHIEPDNAVIQVHARGALSVEAMDRLVREVGARVQDMDAFESVYVRSGVQSQRAGSGDVIGQVQLEFVDWQLRPPASEVLAEVRRRVQNIPGIRATVSARSAGPRRGKPIQIRISGLTLQALESATQWLRDGMRAVGGFTDVTDTRPRPGLEWQLLVDRSEAARYGASVALIGQAIKLVTQGIKVGEYQAANADEPLDIRVRYPQHSRDLAALDDLRIKTGAGGMVPLANFVQREPAQKIELIRRVDGRRTITVEADVASGELVATGIAELRDWLLAHRAQAGLAPTVQFHFSGQNQDLQEAQSFLSKAFMAALALIALIMLTQFNSFWQAFLILSAVIFSIIGVLLGLIVTGRPFSVVMSGVGVIALAGVVVNTNIVLIDTYNINRRSGLAVRDAILATGAERLRPVVLTSITNVVGLLPMVFMLNINLFQRDWSIGAPSTQWWTQLATAVTGGLLFATVLTLVVTPCLLELGARAGRRWGRDTAGAAA